MSGENVKVVRRLYQAMGDRDLEAVKALTDADLEWVSHQRGRGGSSLASTQLAFACIWTLRNGVIVRGGFFLDRKALEAAGLSE